MTIRVTRLLAGFMLCLQFTISDAKQPIKLAIVLDDIGYKQSDLQALTLPVNITFAILPYTPYAKKIAQLARQQNRELLVHVPMQAKKNNEKLGKGALLLGMQENEFKAQLKSAINDIPNATGINNHMGSTLTEQVKEMQWTMDILSNNGLYFLDSRTTAQTIAEDTAHISGIPALRRHIFLDNIKTNEAMEQQLLAAIALGESTPYVVIIAHPYPETIQFLSNKFSIENNQIQLVALQALLSNNERIAMAEKRKELRQVNNIQTEDSVNIDDKQLP